MGTTSDLFDVVLPETDQEHMVEVEGMMVKSSAAQRRAFFSAFIQRTAKMNPRYGGGSMTMLPVVPGVPATGVKVAKKQSVEQIMAKYD